MKRRSVRQQPPPEFLIDRSLGRYTVPEAVRARGVTAHTLFDLYGEDEQHVKDTDWLKDAGANGLSVLTKDPKIRRRAEELAEVPARAAERPADIAVAGRPTDDALRRSDTATHD